MNSHSLQTLKAVSQGLTAYNQRWSFSQKEGGAVGSSLQHRPIVEAGSRRRGVQFSHHNPSVSASFRLSTVGPGFIFCNSLEHEKGAGSVRTGSASVQPGSACSQQENVFLPREGHPIVGKRRVGKRILPPVPVETLSEEKRKESTMRIYALSDLHTDYSLNLEWINDLSKSAYKKDVIIVAGDVSDNVETFRATMAALKDRFEHVFFVPGNHDLWCKPAIGVTDSLSKMATLEGICADLGVDTRPRKLQGVWIIPILSWHHQSFDVEGEIEGYSIPPLEKACMDYRLCRWPDHIRATDESLALLFDNMNDAAPFADAVAAARSDGCQVISFSHFLPRLELCPEKRFLFYPNLPKIVGSRFLEKRVRALHGHAGGPSSCHLFGHTHFAWDATIDGIRYIQAPLAYPKERQRRINGGQDWLPLMLYDTDVGSLCNGPISCQWSNYYRTSARDPSNKELAPWVKDLYKPLASTES